MDTAVCVPHRLRLAVHLLMSDRSKGPRLCISVGSGDQIGATSCQVQQETAVVSVVVTDRQMLGDLETPAEEGAAERAFGIDGVLASMVGQHEGQVVFEAGSFR